MFILHPIAKTKPDRVTQLIKILIEEQILVYIFIFVLWNIKIRLNSILIKTYTPLL